MNSITLSGFLGKKPQITFFPDSGNSEAVLTVSTKRPGKRDTTDWHTVVVQASDTVQNLIKPYADVGTKVTLTGYLGYDSFEGRDNQKIRIAKIFVRHPENFEMQKPAAGEKRTETEESVSSIG